MHISLISIIGTIATIITISSFLFNNIRTIRIVNFIGCLIWLIYGGIKSDVPIIFVNSIIAIIHMMAFIKTEVQKHNDTNNS
jgi:uncharacterized protein with PQ loop repeat